MGTSDEVRRIRNAQQAANDATENLLGRVKKLEARSDRSRERDWKMAAAGAALASGLHAALHVVL